MPRLTGIQTAIALAGSETLLGEALDPPVTQQSINEWKLRGWCPTKRAQEIGALYDIPLSELVSPTVREVMGKR